MLSIQHTRTLLSHIRHSEDESIAFKVGGVDTLAAMDKVSGPDDNVTHGSGSGSDYSDLTGLENETDEFGRRILQHQRDVQRLNNALRPGQRAFRKARPRPRASDRLAQENGRIEVNGDGRPSSAESAASEPAVNPPRQWATKAKPRSEWLRRKQAEGDQGTIEHQNGQNNQQQTDASNIILHRTAYTGDEDWVAVAKDSMDPMETTPPSMRRRRPDSTPSSMQHMNTTVNDTGGGEDGEFTAADLLASTPALNRRDRRIDELTKREIASINERGVTRRNLEQILDHTSLKTAEARPVTAPPEPLSPKIRRRKSLMASKENLPPTGEHNRLYKGAETVGLVSQTSEAVTFKNVQRPGHTRTESYDLLKKLARVSSMSPSPVRSHTKNDSAESDKMTKSVTELDLGPLSAKSSNSDYLATVRPQTADAKVAGKRDEEVAEAQNGFNVQDDEQLPETPPDLPLEPVDKQMVGPPLNTKVEPPDIGTKPAPQPDMQECKTPVVTGAWLDTPAPTTDLRPLLKATDSEINRAFGTPSAIASLEPKHNPLGDLARRVVSEPPLAKSALADVLNAARDEPDVQFGDTTIQSLENIVNPDTEATDTALSIDITEIAQEVADALDAEGGAHSLTQSEKDRRQERLAIEAMNKHLRAARTSIKDANRGLRRVENKIETAQASQIAPSFPTTTSITPSPNTNHHSHICLTCGHPAPTSAWRTLWAELTSCFYTLPAPTPTTPTLGSRLRHIRLTYLGLACLCWTGWFLIETALCWHYCPVLYAEHMVGYGVKEWNAPQFPFVLPTVIFRPWRRVWEPVVDAVGCWVGSVVGWSEPVAVPVPAFGGGGVGGGGRVRGSLVSEGFGTTAEWARTATQGVVRASERVVLSAVDAAAEVGSMWEDEVVGQ
ncbi:hypothetical protein LTR62_008384 [Meristemomyces frigidus]|uniref:Uncharacterized protein n=1 Tax=Meristemomyces frigidus TaxID=1508187 RepID=A0AAN7YN93_9PEZI|nr:hypothetical protein LTR62_008384 [Meristemomyces frigidus]